MTSCCYNLLILSYNFSKQGKYCVKFYVSTHTFRRIVWHLGRHESRTVAQNVILAHYIMIHIYFINMSYKWSHITNATSETVRSSVCLGYHKNIKNIRVWFTSHVCEKSTSNWWLPSQKASNAFLRRDVSMQWWKGLVVYEAQWMCHNGSLYSMFCAIYQLIRGLGLWFGWAEGRTGQTEKQGWPKKSLRLRVIRSINNSAGLS